MATCQSCGEQNPDGARFCSACGVPLTPSSAREVRKTVTVLFADVSGSTALGEQLDPEAFRRVMARYFEAAKVCIERHGGTVEKFIGDAVMAVFGVPTVHEDDALRALRAAAELRDSLASLNDEFERDFGVSLQLRTGVNTGEVVTGTEERLATGDAVNVASRLEQAAQPGRDPDRRTDPPSFSRGDRGRARRASVAQREDGSRPRVPPAAGDRGRARLRPAARRTARRASRRARAQCARLSTGRCRSDAAVSSPLSGRRESARRGLPGSWQRCWRARRPSSPAAAFRTAKGSHTGRWSRSSGTRVPRTSLQQRSPPSRRRRSSGRSGRHSSDVRASSRSRSSSTTSIGPSRRCSTS